MKQSLTYEDISILLRKRVDDAGSQKKLAEQLGIGAPYLHDLLAGNRPITPLIARKLGYQIVIRFDPITEALEATPKEE